MATKDTRVKHGCYHHPLYQTWKSMRTRCRTFETYIAKGIAIYPAWEQDPKAFIEYMEATIGHKPKGKSLDRINNNKGYQPNNLRWATPKEQSNNRARPHGKKVTYRGVEYISIVQAAEAHNLSSDGMRYRLLNGL